MSEQDSTTEPEVTDEATEEPTTDVEESDAPEADEDETPDWRKNFDPDKAAARINKLQSEAKNLRERAKQAEQKAKGADDKDNRISTLEAENLRLAVGYELGLPLELASRLRGANKDELVEDARALVELVGTPKAPTQRKPVEALRGGGQPEKEPEETDVRKIGARMFSN